MKKLTKTQVIARIKKLAEGESVNVQIVPCKMNPNSMWYSGHEFEFSSVDSFLHFIDSFMIHNCTSETGYYPAYYVKY